MLILYENANAGPDALPIVLSEDPPASFLSRETDDLFLTREKDGEAIYCQLRSQPADLERQGRDILAVLHKLPHQNFVLQSKDAAKTQSILNGMQIADFQFDKYKKKSSPEKNLYFSGILDEVQSQIIEAAKKSRALIHEPSNTLTPENFSGLIADTFNDIENITVRVLNSEDIQKERMAALYGVAKGSAEAPYVVCIEYKGGADGKKPVLLVGKGVTFDAGGISMKTEADMEQFPMKIDMAGAASVFGALRAAANLKLPINAVGIVGLVENMPSGTAQKPSDIVRTRQGKTVEIMTTDCEGRLILADLLDYGVEKYAPVEIIDMATLEIGTMYALHDVYAGLFTTDDALAAALTAAGTAACEPLWRLPLHPLYNDLIISDIADLKNRNGYTKFGSGSTAAAFLQNFVPETIPWAHIDIAGVSIRARGIDAAGAGISGFGTRLLATYLAQKCQRIR